MIPRDTIDRIFSATRIEDVVSQYVSLKKRGANLIGLCPFHTEKTGSFTVSPSKGIYKCFGCGKSGHAASFLMEIEQCSYPDALRMLAKRYGIPIEEREMTQEEKQQQDDRESMFVVNEFANQWFQDQLWNHAEGQAIGLSYFRERGLREETIRRFQLGYSPAKGNPLTEALKKKNFQETFLISNTDTGIGTGLVGKTDDGRLYDRFRDRVMFPIFTLSGKTVAFAGRILRQKENTGKYVNSPDSIIYSKTRELYGIFQAKQSIAREDRCYLVEGQMDVLSFYQAGIQNVVSSGGTALTKEQVRLIHRFTGNITVIYDGDAAGIHAALRGIDMILEEGMNVQVLLLPDGHDPDSFARSMDAAALIDYIRTHTTDFIHFKASLLLGEAAQDPIQRSKALTDILRSIALEPELVKRSEHIRLCAQLSGSSEQALQRAMTRQRKQYLDDKLQKKDTPSAEGRQTDAMPPQDVDQSLMYNQSDLRTKQRLNQLDANYRNLLQVLVRDGNKPLYTLEDGHVVTAAEYIIGQLRQDAIVMPNSVYQQLVNEYEANIDDPNFDPKKYFQFHSDPQLSQLAVELLADPYPLSRIFSKQYISENVVAAEVEQEDSEGLINRIIQLLLELKFNLVNLRLDELQLQIGKAQANHSPIAEQEDLLMQQNQLLLIRAQINKSLGNRITT